MITRTETGDAYLPLKVLAMYSGLGIRTLRGYLTHSSQSLPHNRIGGKILVKRSEFDAWAARFRASAPAVVDALVADVLRGL